MDSAKTVNHILRSKLSMIVSQIFVMNFPFCCHLVNAKDVNIIVGERIKENVLHPLDVVIMKFSEIMDNVASVNHILENKTINV